LSAIYEVTAEADDEIAGEFASWLTRHVAEIVAAAGFKHALISELDNSAAGTRTWVTHYHAEHPDQITSYIINLAPRFRADAVQRFGARARVSRRILILQERVPDLTVESEKSHIGSNYRKDESMNTQASWNRIRNEFTRLTDVNELKSEVHRIGTELRKFDFHTVLSPSAKARVKKFERRYVDLMRTVQQAQRQVDREFNKILRQVKSRQGMVTKVMKQQKSKLDGLRKKLSATSMKMKKAKTATARTKTAGTKKRRK